MLATSLKPESSRNYVRLVKAHTSLTRQSQLSPSPSPQYALHFCHLVAQSQSREKMWGTSEKFHLLALQSSTEKCIWHRLPPLLFLNLKDKDTADLKCNP